MDFVKSPARTVFACLAFALAANAQAADVAQPLQFPSISDMIEDRGDYAAENETFKLLSTSPLKIQLAPDVVPGDLPENVQRELRRAALYAVYRTFVHTNAKQVEVVAIPREVHLGPTPTFKFLDKPNVRIRVTREQALMAAASLTKAKSYADLVKAEKPSDMQMDDWVDAFENLYVSDEGQQQLFKAIKAAGGDLVNNG